MKMKMIITKRKSTEEFGKEQRKLSAARMVTEENSFAVPNCQETLRSVLAASTEKACDSPKTTPFQ
jgi:hypothetical protein